MSDCVGVAVVEKICQNIIHKPEHGEHIDDEKHDENIRPYNIHSVEDSCELQPLQHKT